MKPTDFSKLKMTAISSPDDATINWFAAFACYGGHGAENTVVVPFSIPPGGHLGWHTDSLEETQYIIAGSGELQARPKFLTGGPGQHLCTAEGPAARPAQYRNGAAVGHRLFSGEALTQTFDNVMRPTNSHVLASPNVTG